MKIVGIEKLSMVDFGDKLTCTLFTSGCNFRCPFCHNSSLVLPTAEQTVLPNTQILDYLAKRKGMLDAVCITGGEPTLHKDLGDFLAEIKALGYPIKLDSNGTNPDMLQQLYADGLIDYVAMDIKNSPAKYPLTAGIQDLDFGKITASAAFLMSSGIDYEFRTTLIGGHHTQQDMHDIGVWLRGAKLFYLQHFEDSENCISAGLTAIPQDVAQEYSNILSGYVRKVILRGY